MLVSSTEPAELRQIGTSSQFPEQFGVDYYWIGAHGKSCGVQRKEVNDLLASINDGRLAKEVQQMQSLDLAVLVVEGKLFWTNDGFLHHSYAKWKRSQFRGLIASIQSNQVWVDYTDSIKDTSDWILSFEAWTMKEEHLSMLRRKKPSSSWGKADNRAFRLHLLQSIDGIGPQTAADILDHFGCMPFGWRIQYEQLLEIPGISHVTAQKIWQTLEPLPVHVLPKSKSKAKPKKAKSNG